MDIDYEKTFGFKPESIGNRYRHHWVVVQPDSDEQRHGVAAGYLCVKARDGGYNPIDPDACRHPNFVASEDDPPDGMRFYYYRPLTDADREDPAATITALRARVAELEGAATTHQRTLEALREALEQARNGLNAAFPLVDTDIWPQRKKAVEIGIAAATAALARIKEPHHG